MAPTPTWPAWRRSVADFGTPERVAAREELDAVIRRLEALMPKPGACGACGEPDCEECETGVKAPLLNGWVLVLEWVDADGGGKSSIGICPGPGMGYSHQRGLLDIALDSH